MKEKPARKTFIPGDRSRHLALLISLLFLFVITPFVVVLHYGVVLITVVGAIVLLLGVHAVSKRRGPFAVAAVLAVGTITANWLAIVWPGKWIVAASHGLVLLLLGVFSVSILGHVLRAGRISADKIYAAICVYLLVGYAWAFGYAIMELMQPGSFSGLVEHGDAENVERVMQMRYFSFATLTTVGYGDIIPRSPAARTLATLEAIMGQMYLAVLVARLVGLHIVHATGPRSDDRS